MARSQKDWYLIDNIHDIDSPALVIYPDRVRKNIALLKTMIDDVERLRPHVKTHKCREASLLLIEAGINKFKCATIAEAEMLATVNAKDVLLAYQPVGPKLKRFINLIKNYPSTNFSCLTDNPDVAKQISTEAVRSEIIIPVYIDLNVGMNRTGIRASNCIQLIEECSQLKGIKIIGLHVYDGHIHDEDLGVRTKQADEVLEIVRGVKRDLVDKGYKNLSVVAGGSPTFPIYAKQKDIECSPGTFIYWDAGYEKAFKEQAFLPAALLITRVISLPDDQTVCSDLGHKSVAAENALERRFRIMNQSGLKVTGQNEEHLMLRTDKAHDYKVGDVLYVMPQHICPTCALYEKAVIVVNGIASGEWKIVARDRQIGC